MNLAFLKIDIDSIDCAIANQTLALGYRPAFLQMEFNPEVPPPIRFTPMYHEHANYNHILGCFSCSLQGEVDVVTRFGYAQQANGGGCADQRCERRREQRGQRAAKRRKIGVLGQPGVHLRIRVDIFRHAITVGLLRSKHGSEGSATSRHGILGAV